MKKPCNLIPGPAEVCHWRGRGKGVEYGNLGFFKFWIPPAGGSKSCRSHSIGRGGRTELEEFVGTTVSGFRGVEGSRGFGGSVFSHRLFRARGSIPECFQSHEAVLCCKCMTKENALQA